jgi:hypothetical protein
MAGPDGGQRWSVDHVPSLPHPPLWIPCGACRRPVDVWVARSLRVVGGVARADESMARCLFCDLAADPHPSPRRERLLVHNLDGREVRARVDLPADVPVTLFQFQTVGRQVPSWEADQTIVYWCVKAAAWDAGLAPPANPYEADGGAGGPAWLVTLETRFSRADAVGPWMHYSWSWRFPRRDAEMRLLRPPGAVFPLELYQDLMRSVAYVDALPRPHSGQGPAVDPEDFAARIPAVYWDLAGEYDRVTHELIGERFGGMSGRTARRYVKRYRDAGNPWPPPKPET